MDGQGNWKDNNNMVHSYYAVNFLYAEWRRLFSQRILATRLWLGSEATTCWEEDKERVTWNGVERVLPKGRRRTRSGGVRKLWSLEGCGGCWCKNSLIPRTDYGKCLRRIKHEYTKEKQIQEKRRVEVPRIFKIEWVAVWREVKILAVRYRESENRRHSLG